MNNGHDGFNNSRCLGETAGIRRALTAADDRVKAFIASAQNVLVLFIGRPWSTLWQATGFPNGSVQVPRSLMDRLILVGKLGNYFQANPERQSPEHNVTGSKASELKIALQHAMSAVGVGEADLDVARLAAASTERALRWRLAALVSELRLLLDDDDPTWYRIGLNRPSDPSAPLAPAKVVVTGGPPGTIHVSWAVSRRAERYRIYKKEDPEGEFVPIAATTGSFAKIDGLEAGRTLLIHVRATNAAGESQPSAPAEILVPTEPAAPAQA